MQIKLVGEIGGDLQMNEAVFDRKCNEPLIHQIVTAYLSNAHSGSKAQKTRSQVRGGGAKPWRQKGTGRARAGTIRSPLWRGGGVIFAASPKQTTKKVNKQMYKAAMCSILSELLRQERLIIIETLRCEKPKTKELLIQLNDLKLQDVLIVVDKVEENLKLAARNMVKVKPIAASRLNPVSLLTHEKVLMTQMAVKQIEEWLG